LRMRLVGEACYLGFFPVDRCHRWATMQGGWDSDGKKMEKRWKKMEKRWRKDGKR
jgi:hypothetical protein